MHITLFSITIPRINAKNDIKNMKLAMNCSYKTPWLPTHFSEWESFPVLGYCFVIIIIIFIPAKPLMIWACSTNLPQAFCSQDRENWTKLSVFVILYLFWDKDIRISLRGKKSFPTKHSLIAVARDAFEMICYMAEVVAHLYRRRKMAPTQGRGEGVWFNILSIFWIRVIRLDGT